MAQGSETTKIKLYPPSSIPPDDQKDDNTLTVLSYNVLFKDWCTEDMYPFASDEHRSWNYRLKLLRERIKSYSADIICLQECHLEPFAFREDFADFFAELSYDYILPPVKKTSTKYKWQGKWGTAILYNSKRFKCVYQEFRNRTMLCGFTDIIAMKNDEKCTNFEDNDNNTICIEHSFFVSNAHLAGAPDKHDKRLNQIKNVINKLMHFGKINQKPENMRVIICGDFNSGKTCIIDEYFTSGKYGKNKHSFKFKDSYHEALRSLFEKDKNKQIDPFFDRLEWFPTYGNGENISALDFMYFTANNMILDGVCKTLEFDDQMLKKIQNDIRKIRKDPKKGDIEENVNVKSKNCLCLPNERFGSDHLPIAAKFILSGIDQTEQTEYDPFHLSNDGKTKNQKKGKKSKKKQENVKANSTWKFRKMNSF